MGSSSGAAAGAAIGAAIGSAIKDACRDNCGPLTRVQAFQAAQQIAQVSRKERYYVPFSELNKTSRGSCYAGLIKQGAKYLGYGCEWQNVEIVDHPDGHAHMPVGHHDCPHIHIYKNGQSIAEIKYKRGLF